jgi:hypothetical protein
MTSWKPDPPCSICGVLHCPNPAHPVPRPIRERVMFQWRLACGLTCPGHGGYGSRHTVSSSSQLSVVKAGQRFGVLCKSCQAHGAPYRGPLFD